MSKGTAEARRNAKARAQLRRHCRYFAYCGNTLTTYAERHRGICKSCHTPSDDPLDEIVRIDALLEAERRGTALPQCQAKVKRLDEREWWPVAPLRQFHDELLARASNANGATYEVAAARFGVSGRTMYRHLSSDEIPLDTLERLLDRAGIPLAAMYPEGRETEVEEIKVEVDNRCRTPGCHAERADGERFCPDHLAILRRVKAEEKQRLRDFKAKIGRDSRPLCCSPHCQNERTPPGAFCDDCQEAGMVEEEDE